MSAEKKVTQPSPQSKTHRRTLGTWAMVLFFLLLTIVPIFKSCGHDEMARWSAAVAFNEYEQGDHQLAIVHLRDILKGSKENRELKIHLARWLVDEGELDDALPLIQELNEVIPQELEQVGLQQMGEAMQLSQIRFDAELQDKRPVQALEVLKFLEELWKRQRDYLPINAFTDRSNERSYYRARTGLELDFAESEMELFFQKLEKAGQFGYLDEILTLKSKTSIASALLASEAKLQDLVTPLLDQQLASYEKEDHLNERRMLTHAFLHAQKILPWTSATSEEILPARYTAEVTRNQMNALRLVRALLNDQQGKYQVANSDRTKLLELNYDEKLKMKQLPSRDECLFWIRVGSAYLDTWGWIQFKKGKSLQALDSINVAIAAAEIEYELATTGRANLQESSSTWHEQLNRSRQSLATLIKHRYQIAIAMQERVLAVQDKQRIAELGFAIDAPVLDQ